MKTLKPWVKIVIFLAIVGIICLYLNNWFTAVDCSTVELEDEKNQCYVEQAVRKNNVELCSSNIITNPQTEDYCKHEVAVESENPEICELIENDVWKGSCFKNIGMSLNDYTLCSKSPFGDDRMECFFDVATATNDPKPCFFIENYLRRGFCIETIAVQLKDISICELEDQSPPHIVGQCYTSVAVALDDPEVCNKFKGQTKDYCLSKFETN
tara:strand:- start:2061 stop:2696 length:636 start_codon:yes stop_codon:yes gene_type:complete